MHVNLCNKYMHWCFIPSQVTHSFCATQYIQSKSPLLGTRHRDRQDRHQAGTGTQIQTHVIDCLQLARTHKPQREDRHRDGNRGLNQAHSWLHHSKRSALISFLNAALIHIDNSESPVNLFLGDMIKKSLNGPRHIFKHFTSHFSGSCTIWTSFLALNVTFPQV